MKYLSAIASEGIGVGRDYNLPVTKSYVGSFPFTGEVKTVIVDQVVE